MANYSDTEGEIFEVDYLLDHRGRGKAVEYLVRWRGFGEEEDSWEPAKNLGAAKEALLAYRAKSMTPRRKSQSRELSGEVDADSERSSSRTKTGTVTKTVIKTQTITKTQAKNIQASMSESSSPEASPTVTRKSLRSQKTEETEVKKASGSNNAKKSDGPGRLSSLGKSVGSILTAPCRMCHCIRLGTKDIPIMILVTCLMVIASSFYIAGK